MAADQSKEYLKQLLNVIRRCIVPGTTVDAVNVTLSSGTSLIGSVSINQTTPGTTNFVQNKEMPDATATFSITPYISSTLEASAVIKASAGNLYGGVFTNGNGSLIYFQVFNSATVPADTTVPALTFPVAAGQSFTFDTGKFGNFFTNGISVCNSTTQFTKTLGSADSLFYIQKQ